jgi:hypothetical protein
VDAPPFTAVLEELRLQVATLTRDLAEKDTLIEEFCQQRQANERMAQARIATEIEKYEADLHGMRRQLEADRQAL